MTRQAGKAGTRAVKRHFFSLLFILSLFSSAYGLEITGTITCHDPSTIIYEDGRYWYFSTGNNLLSRYSTDLVTWYSGTRPFSYSSGVPPYMASYLATCEGSGPWNLWAPDIIKVGDLYYLYYSRNMCYDYNCTEQSVCGLAIGSNILNRDWVDQGSVLWTSLCTDYRRSIDPALLFDTAGNLWLAAGSFGHPSTNGWIYGGIWLYQIDPATGKVKSGTTPTQLARAWIEAAYLYYKDGYYYLFFNQERCCAGVNSTYFIRYARAANITGPYFDRDGINVLTQDTGSLFLGRDYTANYNTDGSPKPELGSVGREIGPGHIGIFTAQDGLEMFSFHFYDADDNGIAKLGLRTLIWGDDGWPRAGWNLPDGNYAIVCGMNRDPGAPAGGLYLEATDAYTDTVQMNTWKGGTDQIWTFTRVGLNQYKITCLANGKVLAVVSPDGNPSNIYGPGKPVKLVPYSSTNNAHRWYVVQTNNRGFRMLNVATSMALEVAGAQNAVGASLDVGGWDSSQPGHQCFWLTPAGMYSMEMQYGGLPASVANTSSGTRLALADWNGSNLQKWRFIPTFDGYTKIVNVASSLPVDLRNGSFSDGEYIRQWTDLNNDAQKWAIEPLTDSSFRILNKITAKAVSVAGSTSGSYTRQWRWLHTLAQQWRFTQQAASPNARVWTGGGVSGDWSEIANWDVPSYGADNLLFGGTLQTAANNNLAADKQVNGIRFLNTAGSFTLSGNRIMLLGDIVNESPFMQTIGMPLQLAGGRRYLLAAQAGDLIVSGAISGDGHLAKGGAGMVTLAGPCTYTGATRILAGTLKMGADLALPTSTDLTIESGAVLDLNGREITVSTLTNLGTIVNSSCQGAVLNVLTPPQTWVLPGNGMNGLAVLAEHWLSADCAGPDWCMGADRNQSGQVDLADLETLAAEWLLCQ
ncbi:MAG TPA: family 43 glycosylhydrolase [Anaerohalosphaeraceae bacterium]|nr:family 43 glycosylhydrolase [Anaerohalosphaeraceae bacterium]